MALARVIILLLAVTALLTKKYFFITEVASYRGVLQSQSKSRFYITVTFKRSYHTLAKLQEQLIMVVIPICVPMPSTTVSCVTTRSWAMFTTNAPTGFFSLTEPLIVRGIDSNGSWSFSARQPVQFCMDTVSWIGSQPLPGLNKNSYGRAFISVTGDPRPVAGARQACPLRLCNSWLSSCKRAGQPHVTEGAD